MNSVNLTRIDTQHGRTGTNQSSIRSPLHKNSDTTMNLSKVHVIHFSCLKKSIVSVKDHCGGNLISTLAYPSCVVEIS